MAPGHSLRSIQQFLCNRIRCRSSKASGHGPTDPFRFSKTKRLAQTEAAEPTNFASFLVITKIPAQQHILSLPFGWHQRQWRWIKITGNPMQGLPPFQTGFMENAGPRPIQTEHCPRHYFRMHDEGLNNFRRLDRVKGGAFPERLCLWKSGWAASTESSKSRMACGMAISASLLPSMPSAFSQRQFGSTYSHSRPRPGG
jgi:hypothetical protein